MIHRYRMIVLFWMKINAWSSLWRNYAEIWSVSSHMSGPFIHPSPGKGIVGEFQPSLLLLYLRGAWFSCR